jgi:hypothetical protein
MRIERFCRYEMLTLEEEAATGVAEGSCRAEVARRGISRDTERGRTGVARGLKVVVGPNMVTCTHPFVRQWSRFRSSPVTRG